MTREVQLQNSGLTNEYLEIIFVDVSCMSFMVTLAWLHAFPVSSVARVCRDCIPIDAKREQSRMCRKVECRTLIVLVGTQMLVQLVLLSRMAQFGPQARPRRCIRSSCSPRSPLAIARQLFLATTVALHAVLTLDPCQRNEIDGVTLASWGGLKLLRELRLQQGRENCC
jgi:hypothetical protein